MTLTTCSSLSEGDRRENKQDSIISAITAFMGAQGRGSAIEFSMLIGSLFSCAMFKETWLKP